MMSIHIKADSVSAGWIQSMKHLLEIRSTDANVIVEIKAPIESPGVRQHFDQFLSDFGLDAIDRVADTLFPIDFYHGSPGQAARDHLYRCQRMAARFEKRFIGVTYFDRLIDWPFLTKNGDNKTWNQLEHRIKRLRAANNRGTKTYNAVEFGVSSGLPEMSNGTEVDEDYIFDEMRTFHSSKDTGIYGFPCLSHLSITVLRGEVHLTATYRNQHFINKAYGNYVGLMRLLHFIAREAGYRVGSLTCMATHADPEAGKNGVPGRTNLIRLVKECEAHHAQSIADGLMRTI